MMLLGFQRALSMAQNRFAFRWHALQTALFLAFLAGCGSGVEPSDKRDLFPFGNSRPTTEIVNPQLAGEEETFNLLVSWSGFDDDGAIAGFEIAVDDTSSWHFTTAFESLFVFSAPGCCLTDTLPQPQGLPDSLRDVSFGFHNLFVRAVDNEGAEDTSPDHISFTSTNLFPKTVILRGPAQIPSQAQTATTVVLEWEGQDEDGVVAGYRYKLEDDGVWVDVGADCTHVRFTDLASAEFVGDVRGFHEFEVISIDNAGAVERFIEAPRNRRVWEALEEKRGSLRIDSNVMGTRFGISTLEGEVFAGTRVFFDWRGDASLYGGIILCYEFAFDQQEVFSACGLDNTHYPADAPDIIPTIGSHILFVNAYDDAGQKLQASFPFVVLRGPGDIPPEGRRIFYVDDFDNGPTEEFPDDAKEDRFWVDTLLAGYPTSSFDADFQNKVPSARQVGGSTTLIWYVDDSGTQLETANEPTNFVNPIPPYVNAGGNLILCGSVPTDALTPDNHFDPEEVLNGCVHRPQDAFQGSCGFCLEWFPAFCDTGLSFVYDFLKIRRSFNSPPDPLGDQNLYALESEFGSLPSIEIDTTRAGRAPGGQLLLQKFGLPHVESYELRALDVDDPDVLIPLWRYVNRAGEAGRVCAVYIPKSPETGRGHVVILGFPPYFFYTEDMRDVFRFFLDMFGEQRSSS